MVVANSKSQINFRTPYPRPSRLSNPFKHFSQSELKRILQTANDQLIFSDFRTIFHWSTPAGTYEEVAHFLPCALEYMRCDPNGAREFISGILCFVSGHAVQLGKDSLLSHINEAIRSCFEIWTSQFVVEHFDEKACQQRGWGIKHFDCVRNSEIVRELFESLQKYQIFKNLAAELLESLATAQGKATKSAWFLEYAREAGESVFERELLQRHYKSIEMTLVANEPSPTYWETIRKELDLSE
jgi:hypothetical protein